MRPFWVNLEWKKKKVYVKKNKPRREKYHWNLILSYWSGRTLPISTLSPHERARLLCNWSLTIMIFLSKFSLQSVFQMDRSRVKCQSWWLADSFSLLPPPPPTPLKWWIISPLWFTNFTPNHTPLGSIPSIRKCRPSQSYLERCQPWAL